MKRFLFTLLEITVAIAIMVLLTGIVIVRISQAPATAVADRVSSSIQKLFSSASFISQIKNEPVEVIYDPESRQFKISSTNITEGWAIEELSSENIPEIFEVKFFFPTKAIETQQPIYKFYPDGSASGVPFSIVSKHFSINFSISSLTGYLLVSVNQNQY